MRHQSQLHRDIIHDAQDGCSKQSATDFTSAEMGSQEAALACLHADAVVLLMRLELAAGLSHQEAAAARHQHSLAAGLEKHQAQAAIWGKTTTTQQRLNQAKLQKVQYFLFCTQLCC